MKNDMPEIIFMMSFLNCIKDVKDQDFSNSYAKMINLNKNILMNNGCRFMEDREPLVKIVEINNFYKIHFVVNCMGNKLNQFMDYSDNGNYKNLIIFVDYFKDIKTTWLDEYDENGIKNIDDNSDCFYAIKTITEMFLKSLYNPATITGSFMHTINANKFRYNPVIISCIILNYFRPLIDDDIEGSGMAFDDIMNIINNNIPVHEVLQGRRIGE